MKEKDIYYSAIEANIANKNRIYRKAVNSRQRPGLKRGLAVAAACFVVMASVVACVRRPGQWCSTGSSRR